MNQQIRGLFDKFLEGNCSKEELQDLLNHFDENGEDSPLISQIRLVLADQNDLPESVKIRVENILKETDQRLNQLIIKKKRVLFISWRWVAAAVLFLLGTFMLYKNVYVDYLKDSLLVGENIELDLNKENTTIRLPDGKIFDIKEGEEIIEIDGKGFFYSDGSILGENLDQQNISVVIPTGKQLRVKLPDGSLVWLNSASSLKYPSDFGQRNRTISLEGEAYFEIAHDENKPFIIKSEKQEIKVLGTKFGLRSYQNEKSLTTLLEGSIQVTVANKSRFVLKPGDQLERDDEKALINQVEAEEYLAWKDGLFIFHNTPLQEVLRQLSRWYGLEINYGDFPNTAIYAEIHKNTSLSTVLSILEQASEVHFCIEGRRLMKK